MTLNIVAWHGRNASDHGELARRYAAQGFRYLSFAIYGEPTDPRYATVMVLRPVIVAQQAFHGQNAAQFQQTFNDMSEQGWGPFIVSATGSANDPLIASVFQMIQPTPLTRFGLTEAELNALNVQVKKSGGILHWADAYGSADDTRFIAVWHPHPSGAGWNSGSMTDALQNAMNDTPGDSQRRFNALAGAGARPAHIALTPKPGVLEVYVDDTAGPWESRVFLTSQQYQAKFDELMPKGLVPVRLSVHGAGSAARFAVIFARQEQAEPRTFRARGPQTMPSVPAIDGAMEQFVKAHGIHGASLAMVDGARLVYAKGYTWAGASYPDVEPTTLFRQASVSKVLAAVALYRWMQLHPQTTLDTTMQSVLNLTTPSGGTPQDNRFGQITLRHLLESTSGLDNGIIWSDVAAQQAFGTALPVTPLQLARYGATLNLTNTPGDSAQVHYGNAAYFYLSLVLSHLYQTQHLGVDSFEAALQQALLTPLHLTRVRGSRSGVTQQLPDEARYHLDALPVALSLRQDDRPWLASQYGGWSMENFDGCGGLSAATVDLARIAAMLSVRQGNPLLSGASIDALLGNAAWATGHLTGPDAHGYHGWDWVSAVDPTQNVYSGSKGGWLPSHQSSLIFTIGGLSYVIAINGNTREGLTADWYEEVKSVAETYDWGSADLFPVFGMPAFPNTPAGLPGGQVRGVEPVQQAASAGVVRASLLRQMPASGPQALAARPVR